MPDVLDLPLCLTRDQVARLCNVAESSLPALMKKGVIPRPIPGTRRWSRDHLQEHLLQRSKGGQDARLGDDDWSV